MTEPDLAASATVVIRCPACGASDAETVAALTGKPGIVCRKCGETWPATRWRNGGPAAVRAPPARGGESPPLLDAQRTLIRYSDGVSKAWAAKIEGDVLPEDQPRSRLSSAAAAIATVSACLFIAVFFAGRESAVGAAPDLARLYAAVGLPVNVAHLEIGRLTAERSPDRDRGQVVLRGTIRSLSDAEEAVPPLTARLYALDGSVAGVRKLLPPAPTIDAGDEIPFELELDSVPGQAAEIVLRFRRPEEPVSVSDASFDTDDR